MRLDYLSACKYVKSECANVGITLKFVDGLDTPHTTGSEIRVRPPSPTWSDEEWLDWEYEVQHEIGHEAPENITPHWKELIEREGVKGKLFYIWNLVCDHIQEKNRLGVYKGRDEVLLRGRARFTANKLLAIDLDGASSMAKKFRVLCVYDIMCRETWNPYLSGLHNTASDLFSSEDMAVWNKILYSGIRIDDGVTMEDSLDIARRLWELLREDEDDEEGDGTGEDGEACEGEGEGDESIEEMLSHVHEYVKPEEDGEVNKDGGKTKYEDEHIYHSPTLIPKECRVIDEKKDSSGLSYSLFDSSKILAVTNGSGLSKKIRRLFTAMKQEVWEHGRKRGVMSNKNLWKATAPIYSTEVFKKRDSKLSVNTALYLLCDLSGSMVSKDKFIHAAQSCILLKETLAPLGVSVEVAGFTEHEDGPVHSIISSFSEKRVSRESMATRFASASGRMCQNSDGESIMWAYNRVKQRNEKRKMIFVLSDGEPAAFNGGPGAEVKFTYDVCKHIQEKTNVELYGIGIMDDNVKLFYKDYAIIKSAGELENVLLNVVKNKLLAA